MNEPHWFTAASTVVYGFIRHSRPTEKQTSVIDWVLNPNLADVECQHSIPNSQLNLLYRDEVVGCCSINRTEIVISKRGRTNLLLENSDFWMTDSKLCHSIPSIDEAFNLCLCLVSGLGSVVLYCGSAKLYWIFGIVEFLSSVSQSLRYSWYDHHQHAVVMSSYREEWERVMERHYESFSRLTLLLKCDILYNQAQLWRTKTTKLHYTAVLCDASVSSAGCSLVVKSRVTEHLD